MMGQGFPPVPDGPEAEDVTIADVARLAGVSVSTVSRVLNNKPDVSEETRNHVEQVIEQLNYRPHSQAKRLASGRSNTVALLYPFEQPGSLIELDFIVSSATSAQEEGYFFNLIMHPLTESDLLQLYRGVQVDGVLLLQVHIHDWRVDFLRKHGYPFVMVGRTDDNRDASFVDLDFKQTLIDAFGYLVEQGHEHIGFINYPPAGNSYTPEEDYGPAIRSAAGYEAVLDKYGLNRLVRSAEFTAKAAGEAALSLLEEEPRLTAIVHADGARSVGVIDTLRDCEKRIPEDVSIVGVTTHRLAELMVPRLTVMDFPSYEMGYRATKMLINELEGRSDRPEQILLTPELNPGKSTAAAP
jgi:DNA-binding LacI/PurR family transcriptional regulator